MQAGRRDPKGTWYRMSHSFFACASACLILYYLEKVVLYNPVWAAAYPDWMEKWEIASISAGAILGAAMGSDDK
jgi:hypothetical protein